MSAEETRSVTVSLVLRLDDICTGHPLMPGDAFRISSADAFHSPLSKPDGYFVFTGQRPDGIRIASKGYETVYLPRSGIEGMILRIAPVPLNTSAKTHFPLTLAEGESAHVGFYGVKSGYPVLSRLEAGTREVSLHKEDYSDVTGLFHAVIPREGQTFAVFVKDGLGYGRYSLSEPLREDIPHRRTRFLPLYRIVGTGRTMAVPVPDDCRSVYVLRGNELSRSDIG